MKSINMKENGQAALSTFFWGIYMALNGISMVTYPNLGLTLMGFEPTQEVYIRLTGLLALVLGFYYIQFGRYYFQPFYYWKVTGHLAGIFIMIFFYLTGLASASILIFCLFDAMAAVWTAWGIIYDQKKKQLVVGG
jgi:hypothetical protein